MSMKVYSVSFFFFKVALMTLNDCWQFREQNILPDCSWGGLVVSDYTQVTSVSLTNTDVIKYWLFDSGELAELCSCCLLMKHVPPVLRQVKMSAVKKICRLHQWWFRFLLLKEQVSCVLVIHLNHSVEICLKSSYLIFLTHQTWKPGVSVFYRCRRIFSWLI